MSTSIEELFIIENPVGKYYHIYYSDENNFCIAELDSDKQYDFNDTTKAFIYFQIEDLKAAIKYLDKKT